MAAIPSGEDRPFQGTLSRTMPGHSDLVDKRGVEPK